MRTLLTWNPVSDMRRTAELMDRMLESYGDSERMVSSAFGVPIDIWEQEADLMIRASVPGVKAEDLDITLDEGVLTISGEVRHESESGSAEGRYFHRECQYGSFSRSVHLPDNVDEDNIDAMFENGMVTVRIPRKDPPKSQPKKLQVRSGSANREEIGVQGQSPRAQNEASAKNAPRGKDQEEGDGKSDKKRDSKKKSE
jgi:HSP20 family protein